MNRRELLEGEAAPCLGRDAECGARVVDVHLHPRRDPELGAAYWQASGQGDVCGCRDGLGKNPIQATPVGKCAARGTLTMLMMPVTQDRG